MLMRVSLAAIGAMLLALIVSGAGAPVSASPGQAPAAKECPAGESITVTAPTAAAPTTVSVSVVPPVNLKPAKDAVADSYHLHYFVDIDPSTVVQSGQAVPSGNPKIIHSATTTQDVGALSAGRHTVWVVLGDVAHIACTPMVVGSVSFDVAAAALPRTGDGAADRDGSMATLLIAFAFGGVALAGAGVVLRRGGGA